MSYVLSFNHVLSIFMTSAYLTYLVYSQVLIACLFFLYFSCDVDSSAYYKIISKEDHSIQLVGDELSYFEDSSQL